MSEKAAVNGQKNFVEKISTFEKLLMEETILPVISFWF